jgi:hypothetical protein
MRHTRLFLSVMVVLCLALGGLHSQATPVTPAPCAVPSVGSPDSVWRQVRASGFTFCVPASWKPGGHAHDSVDAPQWKGDGTSVAWGVGRPRSGLGRGTTAEGRSPIVGRGSGVVGPPPPPVRTQKCEPPTNTPVPVDGGVVLVTQVQCDGVNWTTTGWSTAPAIYVQGEAHSAERADLLVRIMRTIRFTSSP